MKIREYLDKVLNDYFIRILNENGFKKIDSNNSGIGAVYRFKNDSLKFEIINDRGIIETRVASLLSDNFYNLDFIYIYLKQRNKTEIDKPRFGKSNTTVRLNLDQESMFLNNNISELKIMFNEKNYKETESELIKFGNKMDSYC